MIFLKEYIKKMIEYYVLMENDKLMLIDIGSIPIREDKNIIRYILMITENPETSRLIHDKIYGMIHHFARFLTSRGQKCSFESVIALINSDDAPIGIASYFCKPMTIYYIEKVNPELFVSVESVFIHRETFYLYVELCCNNLWAMGHLSTAFKDLIYLYFFGVLQHFKNWITKDAERSVSSGENLQIFLEYIAESYPNNFGNNMRNQILKYEESKQNWININIYRIYEIPEQFIDYCKVIIQYLLIEFIYTGKCIAQSNEKKKIYPVDLFLGMEEPGLLNLPVFFKKLRNF